MNNLKTLISKSLFQKSVLVIIYIVLAKTIQFYKEIIVADEIGASIDLDAFILSLLILSIFLNFLFYPLSNALLPVFIRIRKISIKRANQLFTKTILLASILGLFATGIIYFFAIHLVEILGNNLDSASSEMTRKIILLNLPYFFFSILNSLLGKYLNSINKNFLFSIYTAFPAIFTIFYFLFFPQEIAIYNQVYGFNVGSFVAFLLLTISAFQHGLKLDFSLEHNKPFWLTLKQWSPIIFTSLIIACNPMIDKKMALDFGPESLSQLSYGSKLFTIFSSFAITGITTIYYPYFAQKLADRDFEGIINTLKKTISLAIGPALVASILGFIYSKEIVTILFERGEFTSEDTKIVADIMKFYLISLPVLVFSMLGVRLMNALQKNKEIMYFSIVNLILNITLNIILIKKMGLHGLALSTTLVFVVNAILIWCFLMNYMSKRTNSKT